MTRRELLQRVFTCGSCGLLAVTGCRRSAMAAPVGLTTPTVLPVTSVAVAVADVDLTPYTRRALYFDAKDKLRVVCRLCPRECLVGDRERGFCGVRENQSGVYYTIVYGQAATANVDPIEKKPFFHFLPDSQAFSIATAGCNLDCKACQNWELSQVRPEQVPEAYDLPPQQVADSAERQGCQSIAYTYSEPVVFYEYMLDACKAGHERGVRSAMVSAGYIQAKPLEQLLPHLDAVKIDLKSFSDATYVEYCRGHLQPVLDTIRLIAQAGTWLEVVYLVVPTVNDKPDEIQRAADWLLGAAGPDVPLHFSRFHPYYQLSNLPPTPIQTLARCYDIAQKAGLHFVYVGNVLEPRWAETRCPNCGKAVISRDGFRVTGTNMRGSTCAGCGQRIPGVFS